MATIITHSDLLTRAIVYITEMLAEKSKHDLASLVDDAAMRFNLSPLETESLLRILSDSKK